MSLEELMITGNDKLHEDHMTDTHYKPYDDVSNTPSMLRKARLEELELFKNMKVREMSN